MTTHTFNKEDYSGEEATVNFKADGTFTLNGYDFIIKRTVWACDNFKSEVAKVYDANDKDRKFATATARKDTWLLEEEAKKFGSDKYWTAFGGDDEHEMDIHRDHEFAEVALARVLYNIV
jgi:hypothetical protein